MPTIERIRLGDLAARLGCELHGDPDIEITGVAGVERAGPTELTFLANPKYAPKVKDTRAAAILVKQPLARPQPASLVSANPYHDFARALALFYQPPRPKPGIHPQASRGSHGSDRRRGVDRGVRGGGRARQHRQERGAASARGDL